MSGCRGVMASGWSLAPTRSPATPIAHGEPGPQVITLISVPLLTIRIVTGPDGVRVARQMPSAPMRMVGSPSPCASGASDMRRSIGLSTEMTVSASGWVGNLAVHGQDDRCHGALGGLEIGAVANAAVTLGHHQLAADAAQRIAGTGQH